MQKISATYRVTTPMFLGGAEQQADMRLPSFKGALPSGGVRWHGSGLRMFPASVMKKLHYSAAAMNESGNRR